MIGKFLQNVELKEVLGNLAIEVFPGEILRLNEARRMVCVSDKPDMDFEALLIQAGHRLTMR